MAGAWTTLSVADGGGTARTMRVWDESGTGIGPFSFGQMLTDGSSGGYNSVGALTSAGYQTVAASQSGAGLGGAGAAGDRLDHLIIVPATTSPGAVSIKDGGGSSITLFPGGASSVADLKPIYVPIAAKSAAGGWSVTTGSNVSVIAVGNFA